MHRYDIGPVWCVSIPGTAHNNTENLSSGPKIPFFPSEGATGNKQPNAYSPSLHTSGGCSTSFSGGMFTNHGTMMSAVLLMSVTGGSS